MKSGPLSLAALAGAVIFCTQMSGWHLHAGTNPDGAGLQGAHVHGIGPEDHDHSAAIDASLIDFGIVWSKIVPVPLAVLPTLLAIVWILHALQAPLVAVSFRRWRLRWRPPLRAPPLSL